MITEIGITAGDIWHYLDQHKDATVDEMAKNIGKSRDLILMSVGWLAREGHVSLKEDKDGYRTWLNIR